MEGSLAVFPTTGQAGSEPHGRADHATRRAYVVAMVTAAASACVMLAALGLLNRQQHSLLQTREVIRLSREALAASMAQQLAIANAAPDKVVAWHAVTLATLDSLARVVPGQDRLHESVLALRTDVASRGAGRPAPRDAFLRLRDGAESRYRAAVQKTTRALWTMAAAVLASLLVLVAIVHGLRAVVLRQARSLDKRHAELMQANQALRLHGQEMESANVELETLTDTLRGQAVELEEQAADLYAANLQLEQSNANLAETMREQAALLAALPEIVVVYDRDGQYLKVSRAFEHSTMPVGTDRIGRQVHEFMPHETADQIVAIIRDTLSAGAMRVAEISLDLGGETHWFECTAVPLDRGRVMCVARDITARKASEEALRSRDTRFRLFAEATNEVFFESDLESRQVEWIGALESALRHEPGALGTIDAWRDHLHPDDREHVLASARKVLEGRESVWLAEYRFRRGDGSYARIMSRAHVMRGESGKAHHLLGSMLDVSDRRQLEDQLRQAQKMEAIGQLAGGVAHDFNNLLTVITSYASMALETDTLGADERESLMEIEGAARRAAGLTRQLLTFSRQRVYEPRVVDVNQAIEEAERLLRRLLPANVEFEVMLGDDTGTVLADAQQIGQVLVNLAVNARDAMPNGGTLRLETRRVVLTEAVLAAQEVPPGSYAAITVTDTGTGMTAEVRERMFEPFFTTKVIGEGTGLGLATVYGIVHQFGGRIGVYSEPGLGTTFRVLLPSADGMSVAAAPPPPLVAGQANGNELVLVVDDNPTVRRVVTLSLRRGGYAVVEADNGETALALLDSLVTLPALLVSDLVMPGLGGKELLDGIAERGLPCRALLMSGYSRDRVTSAPWMDGVAFIEKPFTGAALLERVREVLDAPPPIRVPKQRAS